MSLAPFLMGEESTGDVVQIVAPITVIVTSPTVTVIVEDEEV